MKPFKWQFLLPILAAVSLAAVFIGPVFNPDTEVLLRLRLPRVVMAVIVGAGLSAAGAVLQGILRNPLADPYILGTSSGAGVGVIASLILGLETSSPLFYLLVITGAGGATFLSYSLARVEKRVPLTNLLLSGIIVSTFLGALILLFLSLLHRESFSILFFLMGSITEGSRTLTIASALLVSAGCAVSLLFARQLDILSLGEEKAIHLGVDAEKLKVILFSSCALMVGAAVAISGTIGFVGLIVPHILRLIVGPGHKKLIPASLLGGSIFLVSMDAVARTAAAPAEIPVGVITALTGAPFFIWLLRKKKKEII